MYVEWKASTQMKITGVQTRRVDVLLNVPSSSTMKGLRWLDFTGGARSGAKLATNLDVQYSTYYVVTRVTQKIRIHRHLLVILFLSIFWK